MSLIKKVSIIAILFLIFGFGYQNCAQNGSDELGYTKAASSSSNTQSSLADNLPLKIESESITNQQVCATNNNVSFIMKKNIFDHSMCLDDSKLMDGVEPGPSCNSGGVNINQIVTNLNVVPCSEMQLCGIRPTNTEDLGNNKIRITFNSLPWGCQAKLQIMSESKSGETGDLLQKFSFSVKPPYCKICSGISTCGACAENQDNGVTSKNGANPEVKNPTTTVKKSFYTCAQQIAPGKFCPVNGAIAAPLICPAGKYCVGGTVANPIKPISCGIGKYSRAGATSVKACLSCENKPSVMTYISKITYLADNTSSNCKFTLTCKTNASVIADGSTCGLICSEKTKLLFPPSGAGYYCSRPASPDISPKVCPAGSSCVGGSEQPVVCPVGKYSNAGSGVCAPCTNKPADMTYVATITYASGNSSSQCRITATTCKTTGKHPSNKDDVTCVKK